MQRARSADERITVVLADDNMIVREGVRALLAHPAVEVVGVAGDRAELVAEAARLHPRVIVTDIRMPPTFQDEGIDAAREIRRLLPGTGVVVDPAREDGELDADDEQLLQYQAPVALLALLLVAPVAILIPNALAAWPGRQAARLRIGHVLRAE